MGKEWAEFRGFGCASVRESRDADMAGDRGEKGGGSRREERSGASSKYHCD